MRSIVCAIVGIGFRVFLCVFMVLFVFFCSQGVALGLAMDTILELNTEQRDLEYPLTLLHLEFTVDVDSGNIMEAWARFDSELAWYPWFDQEEGRPEHEMVTGRFYTQTIPLTESQNFYELQSISKELDHYAAVEPPISDDGTYILYAPEGCGIGFVVEEGGEIYALIRITTQESTGNFLSLEDVSYAIGGHSTHPQLGDIAYTYVLLRDPSQTLDLDQYFSTLDAEETMMEPGDEIPPGFVVETLKMEKAMMGIQLTGTIRNETGQSYQMAIFTVILMTSDGNEAGEGVVQVQNLAHGKSAEFMGLVIPEADVDIEDLLFSITFQQGF